MKADNLHLRSHTCTQHIGDTYSVSRATTTVFTADLPRPPNRGRDDSIFCSLKYTGRKGNVADRHIGLARHDRYGRLKFEAHIHSPAKTLNTHVAIAASTNSERLQANIARKRLAFTGACTGALGIGLGDVCVESRGQSVRK